MFNKEEFIAKYIETLKDETTGEKELSEITATLPQDLDSDFYTGLVQELIHSLKEDGAEAHDEEIKRLENTAALMVFMAELAAQDSNTGVAKEVAVGSQATKDVETDSVAVASEVEGAVEETATKSKEEADGDAPTEEVKAEKSEPKDI